MANYRDLGIADATFKADVDISGSQWYVVMPASVAGGVQRATGASNPGPLGILQNSPSLGQEATVRMMGFSKAIVAANASNYAQVFILPTPVSGSFGQAAC